MSKILLIENNEKLETIYTMNLVLYLGADYIIKTDFEEAVDLINKEPLLSLIITKDTLPEQDIALRLKNYLDDVGKSDIPLIILGDQHKIENLRDNQFVIDSPTNIKAVLKLSAELLNITPSMMAEIEMPTFYPVDIDHFLVIEKTVCDVYIEVENPKANHTKYIKRLMKDYKFPHSIIHDFKKDGMKNMYILSDYRLEFVNQMTNDFLDVMQSETATTQQKMMATGKVKQVFNEKFNSEAFNEEAEALAKECIKSITKLISGAKNLKELLADLLVDQNSYMYVHCQTTAFIADKIIDNMEWGSKEQKEKLHFIIFMHDALLQSDEEAKIATNEELDGSSLDKDAKERVKGHAAQIGEKLLQMTHMPFGADTIIMQHHGSRSGIGFNDDPPNNLSPLAIVFYICERFADAILNSDMTKTDPYDLIEKIHFKHKKKDKYVKAAETLASIDWGYGKR